jgi:hypothetical protein
LSEEIVDVKLITMPKDSIRSTSSVNIELHHRTISPPEAPSEVLNANWSNRLGARASLELAEHGLDCASPKEASCNGR